MEPAFFYDPANLSLIAGLALLGLDIVVIGLSPVMFVAVGALLTSALLYATGWRPALVETAAIVAGAKFPHRLSRQEAVAAVSKRRCRGRPKQRSHRPRIDDDA